MKKQKGFTLIELLAIIVILAIIAVITVPIILGIIDNAKNKAAVDSAYGFKDAIEKYYVTESMVNSESKMNGTYFVDNGIINGSAIDGVEILISGIKPKSGYLRYNNNILQSGCLVVDEYEIIYNNGNFTTMGKGNCTIKIDTTNMELGTKDENIQYYMGGYENEPDNAIYFDPINGIYNCSTYNEDNSIVGFNGVITGEKSTKTTNNQTSCLKWFIYSIDEKGTSNEEDDIVNIILDHNTTSGIAWNEAGKYHEGPDSKFLAQFTSDTSEWTSEKIINPLPYTTYNISQDELYTITYTTKARLIEANEVARVKGYSSWNYLNSSGVGGTSGNKFLKMNLSGSGSENLYYWTSSLRNDGARAAWVVNYNGNLSDRSVKGTTSGIRPVISIYKFDNV